MKTQVRTWPRFILAVIFCVVSYSPAWAAQESQPQNQSQTQQNQSQGPQGQQNQSQGPQGTQGQPAPHPSLQNAPGAAPAQPSPEETEAYQAIQKEQDATKQLQLVKDFEKKYPTSALLSDVDFFGASAAQRGNDVTTAVNYGEKSLKLRPDNLRSLILVADLLPLPQALRGNDQQKQQQLDQSENDANHALQLLNNLQRPPNAPQAQFDRSKALIVAELHGSLGMAHLEKAVMSPKATNPAELASAEQEFKTAVGSPEPNPQDYYRLGEVYVRENKTDDAIKAFTQAAQLGQGTPIQQYANTMVEKLKASQAKKTDSSAH